MTGPQIRIGRDGDRGGFIVATMPAAGQHHSGESLVTGSLYRISRDGEPAEWRAYLWPVAGGVMHVARSCDAVDAATPELLRKKLQKRSDKDGPWWNRAEPAPLVAADLVPAEGGEAA